MVYVTHYIQFCLKILRQILQALQYQQPDSLVFIIVYVLTIFRPQAINSLQKSVCYLLIYVTVIIDLLINGGL